MKILFFGLLIFGVASVAHANTVFTDFFVDNANGDNHNAGDGTSLIFDSGGSWDSVTSSYTASSGTPFSTTTAGNFVSIYQTGKSSTSFVAQIASVGGGGSYLIVYSTRQGGIIPTTGSGFSARTGGVWAGPSTSTARGDAGTFVPFNLITSSMGTQANPVCANFKNNQVYTSTIVINHLVTSPVRFEGYTNTPHDGGYAVFNGSNTAAMTLFSITGGSLYLSNIIFDGTHITAGTSVLVVINGTGYNTYRNLIIRNSRNAGAIFGGNADASNLEFYNNNTANGASTEALNFTGNGKMNNLYIHDSPNSGTSGIRASFSTSQSYQNVIVANVGGSCVNGNGGGLTNITLDFNNFECYKSGSDGMSQTLNDLTQYVFHNANFVQCGGYAINMAASTLFTKVVLDHVGYYQNTSGTINYGPAGGSFIYEDNVFNYTSMPYVNPVIGDFRMKSSQSLDQGDGGYLVTGSTFTALKNYQNIGAVHGPRFPGGAYSFSN